MSSFVMMGFVTRMTRNGARTDPRQPLPDSAAPATRFSCAAVMDPVEHMSRNAVNLVGRIRQGDAARPPSAPRTPRPGSRSRDGCRRRTACDASGRSGTARTDASESRTHCPFQSTSVTSSPSTRYDPFSLTLIVATSATPFSASLRGSPRSIWSCPACRAAVPSPRPARAG